MKVFCECVQLFAGFGVNGHDALFRFLYTSIQYRAKCGRDPKFKLDPQEWNNIGSLNLTPCAKIALFKPVCFFFYCERLKRKFEKN